MMKLKNFLNQIELYLGAVVSGAMFIVLFLQVISRYVFNAAFSWSEELALILFVWSIYLGAAAAIRRHQHLRLEILLDKVSPRIRMMLDLVANFAYALFCGIIMFGIMPIVMRLFNAGTSTAVMNIPKWINYAMLPAMFILMIFRLAQDSVATVQKFRTRTQDIPGAGSGK
jgi:C4-dicarboxylate transporter DctQ subunit